MSSIKAEAECNVEYQLFTCCCEFGERDIYPRLPVPKLRENGHITARDLRRMIQAVTGESNLRIAQKKGLLSTGDVVVDVLAGIRAADKFGIEYYFDWLEVKNLCFLEDDDKLFIPAHSIPWIIVTQSTSSLYQRFCESTLLSL